MMMQICLLRIQGGMHVQPLAPVCGALNRTLAAMCLSVVQVILAHLVCDVSPVQRDHVVTREFPVILGGKEVRDFPVRRAELAFRVKMVSPDHLEDLAGLYVTFYCDCAILLF